MATMMGSWTAQRSGELAFGDKLRARSLWITEGNNGFDIPLTTHFGLAFRVGYFLRGK